MRIDYIVLLRATAITLVVLGHATRSVHAANPHMFSPETTPWWEIGVRTYLYSFHMPLFFWVSGFVFYVSSVEKTQRTTVAQQLAKKVKRLILPLYATSFLVLLPTILCFGHINRSLLFQAKLFLLGVDNDHLWFLRTLFILFVIVIPVYRWRRTDGLLFYAAIAAAWSIAYLCPLVLPNMFRSAIKYFPFFVCGCVVRKYEKQIPLKGLPLLFAVCLVLHLALVVLEVRGITLMPGGLDRYLAAFSGIFFMYALSRHVTPRLSRAALWNSIQRVDASSYTIYLLHVSFLYVALFLNRQLEINAAAFRIPLSFGSGLLVPIWLHRRFSRNRFLSLAFAITVPEATSPATGPLTASRG